MALSPALDSQAHEPCAPQSASRLRQETASAGFVFLGLTLAMLWQGGALLNDGDTQWHIAVGRWIVARGAVPWTDLFSHTFAGQPWIAKEWASQLLLHGAFEAAGWWGVSALAGLTTAASLTLLFVWLSRRLKTTLALTLTLVAFLVLAPHLLARPHLFTMPILLAWMIGLVGALDRRAAPPWPLLLAMTAWANLHGSYPIGLVIAGLLAGEAVFGAAPGERVGRAWRWGLFLAAAAAAALATPYGIRPFLVNLGLWGSGESLRYITEWQPLGLDPSGAAALAALAASVAILAVSPRRSLFRIGVALLLGAMMIRHSRFADLFILAAPILVAGPAARLFPALRAGPGAMAPRWQGAALAVLALAAAILAASVAPRPDPDKTPAAALEAARARGLVGPVYNSYDFGGFLIAQGVPTFIDGRSDQLFLGGFMDGLYGAVDDPGHERFIALLARHGVTWALVRKEGGEARHLAAAPGWARLSEDPVAAVFYRPADQPPAP